MKREREVTITLQYDLAIKKYNTLEPIMKQNKFSAFFI